LSRAHGLDQGQLGGVLWIPPLGWEIGYFFWGWFADRFAAESRRPAWLFWSLAILSLPLMYITMLRSTAAALALMFWAMFVSGGFVVVSLRTASLWYPRERTASVAGIGAGSWSALVAVALPALGRMFDRNDYSAAFVLVALVPVLGTLLWSILTPRQIAAQLP
jgi:ACS family hexuronate transporter-like MFS transporter